MLENHKPVHTSLVATVDMQPTSNDISNDTSNDIGGSTDDQVSNSNELQANEENDLQTNGRNDLQASQATANVLVIESPLGETVPLLQ